MRLIDLDELLKFPIRLDHYDKENGDEHFAYGVEAVLEYAENLPVVDAKPVRHGEWIIKPHGSYGQLRAFCSACGKHSGIGGIESNQRKPFCPNCGADMRATNTNGGKGGAKNDA